MSGILRRTVFRHRVNNTVVLGDWARVSTSLGLCLEPCGKFNPVSFNTGQQAYDPDDQIARVDDMEEIAVGREMFLIGGADSDGRALNGGALWFRTGY